MLENEDPRAKYTVVGFLGSDKNKMVGLFEPIYLDPHGDFFECQDDKVFRKMCDRGLVLEESRSGTLSLLEEFGQASQGDIWRWRPGHRVLLATANFLRGSPSGKVLLLGGDEKTWKQIGSSHIAYFHATTAQETIEKWGEDLLYNARVNFPIRPLVTLESANRAQHCFQRKIKRMEAYALMLAATHRMDTGFLKKDFLRLSKELLAKLNDEEKASVRKMEKELLSI